MSRLLFLSWMVFSPMGGNAESIPKEMLGDWSLNLKSGEAGWLSVSEKDGLPSVAMAVDVGSIKPLSNVTVKEEKIYIPIKKFRKGGKNGKLVRTTRAVVWSENGKLVGEVISLFPDGREEKDPFTGKFVPPMPPKPDLAKVKFGKPVTLFNGKDLTGWKLRRPEKLNGWSVKDGLLVNETPKTDFSATGAYGNLRTEAVFGDFKLHIEFLVERDRNSGVYLRGMYEAQVVDRDSRMQGLQGVGAIFGRVAPSKNAGYEGGKWQTYDLTLVGRHITVILNGEMVVDNQPVPGPTGGAMHTDAMAPGPIYLQGDHTSVKYRNIVLRPAE